MTELEKIEARIAELMPVQTELEELQTAARVLRRLSSASSNDAAARRPPRKRPVRNSSPRTTIREWAITILREKGELHFSEIADEAMKRGYAGRSGTTPEHVRKAFWSTMKRARDDFLAIGAGRFKLQNQAVNDPTENP